MADLLRERLLEVLNHTLSAEAEEAGQTEGTQAATLVEVESVVDSEDPGLEAKDERARVAASVVGALLANTLSTIA